MPRFSTTTALTGVATAFLLVAGAPLAGAVAADAAEPHVVTYDASQAQEFQAAIDEATATWNAQVTNVKFEKATDGQADLTVLADDGWPRAEVPSLGKGTVYMGRQAMDEGYDEVRVASHELGHTLGLPDMKPGPCSSLMSGASAGPECTNPNPDEDEKSEVESNFGDQYAQLRKERLDRVFVDQP